MKRGKTRRALPSPALNFDAPPLLLLRGRRARDYLDDLARDARLSDAVHVERQRLNQLARVLRRRVHRRHARALLARHRLQERAVDLRLDQPRQELAENFGRRLFVLVADAALTARGLFLFPALHGARDRQYLLDDDAL